MACALLLERVSFQYASLRHLKPTSRSCIARPGWVVRATAALLCGAHQVMHAAAATPFAGPEQVVPSSSSGGVLRVAVALLVVLGAVIAAARLARRMRGLGGSANSSLEVLGSLPLGARERAVLVRVGERQLLIGVAPGNVRTLHVFDDLVAPRAPLAGVSEAERPTFKSMLLKSLGK